ncbi:MAG: hypothetical protein HKN10_13430 [Myxococcales bacterium]|nr:hypothetical protein [Deltaproteobacteria bacterium]NNE19472.1 hypothetical protein [Myxococcales bacterium]
MIQSEGARRMIALIAVAVAALAQDFVISEAGANHGTGAPAFLSADLLIDGLGSSLEAARMANQPYGVRLGSDELVAPATPPPATKTVRTRLTLLDLSEAEPVARDAMFHWPVNRDSAGAPIVLNSDFTAPLIKVRF